MTEHKAPPEGSSRGEEIIEFVARPRLSDIEHQVIGRHLKDRVWVQGLLTTEGGVPTVEFPFVGE